jgi:hypothetical protein
LLVIFLEHLQVFAAGSKNLLPGNSLELLQSTAMPGKGITKNSKTGVIQGLAQIAHLRRRAGDPVDQKDRFIACALKKKIVSFRISVLHKFRYYITKILKSTFSLSAF